MALAFVIVPLLQYCWERLQPTDWLGVTMIVAGVSIAVRS